MLPGYLSGDREKNNMYMYYVMLHICKYSSIYPNESILSKTSVYTDISNSSSQQHRLLKLSPLVCMLSCFSHVQLCDPMDCSLPGSSACHSSGKNTGVGCHILQGLFQTRNQAASPVAPALQANSFTSGPPGKPAFLVCL